MRTDLSGFLRASDFWPAALMACALTVPMPSIGATMEQSTFSITVACTGNPSCIFAGNDMPLEITVTNSQSYSIGFPRRYIQARGASMKLVDRETGAAKALKTELTDHALKNDYTMLRPGETLTLTTLIGGTEITSLRPKYVDLVAEFGITADIKVPDSEEPVRARGAGQLKIIGRDTLERDQAR
jgi:hypothetical protein